MRLRVDLTNSRREIKSTLTPEQRDRYEKYIGIENPDLKERYARAFTDQLQPAFEAQAAYKLAHPEYWRYTLWSSEQAREDEEGGIDNYVRDKIAGRLPPHLSDDAMTVRAALTREVEEYRSIPDSNRKLYDDYLARPAAQDRTAFLAGSRRTLQPILDAQRRFRETHPLYQQYSAWAGDQYDEGREAGVDNFLRTVYGGTVKKPQVTDIGKAGNPRPQRGPGSVASGMSR